MDFYSDSDFFPDWSLGYLTRRIHQLGQSALDPIFAEEGMTASQWSALVAIWFGRGNTCAALAREMAHDKGAMTRLVDTLETRGWVTRERDTDDRRIVNLALTEAGEAATLRCRARIIASWNDWLKDWDRSEVETLIGLLQKLRGTLDVATAS